MTPKDREAIRAEADYLLQTDSEGWFDLPSIAARKQARSEGGLGGGRQGGRHPERGRPRCRESLNRSCRG